MATLKYWIGLKSPYPRQPQRRGAGDCYSLQSMSRCKLSLTVCPTVFPTVHLTVRPTVRPTVETPVRSACLPDPSDLSDVSILSIRASDPSVRFVRPIRPSDSSVRPGAWFLGPKDKQ
jgi:hypothetical protein